MFLAASPRGWHGTKPCIQGVGARPEKDGVRVYALHIQQRTRARTITATLTDPQDKRQVRLTWPGLKPGTYTEVHLEYADR